jgi:acyl carrier protein
MKAEALERVRRIAADVLEVPASKITESTSSENLESWDSVRHLNLILALEQEFHIQFEPEEIDEMSDVRQILAVLGRKLQVQS